MKAVRILVVFFVLVLSVSAQMTHALNYQGRLLDGTNLVSGDIELVIRLYDDPTTGTLLCEDSNTVTVVDGLYSTIIGDNITTGGLGGLMFVSPWLEVEVDGTILTPREVMVPVLHALNALDAQSAGWADNAGSAFTAGTAGLASNVANGVVTSVKIANGSISNEDFAASSVTSSTIEDGAIGLADLGQNGAADGQIFKWTNGAWEVGADDVGGGASLLSYSENGTFAVAPSASGVDAVAQGLGSSVSGARSLVAGGSHNQVLSDDATISGGESNVIQSTAEWSVIGGGFLNTIREFARSSVIAGGKLNIMGTNAHESTIGGGDLNILQESVAGAVIAGGSDNILGDSGSYSVMGGGYHNRIRHDSYASTIAGGRWNTIESNNYDAVIGGGSENFMASEAGVIGGGNKNFIGTNSVAATIAGGVSNVIRYNSHGASIGGGCSNTIGEFSRSARIAGGEHNFMESNNMACFIGAGEYNRIFHESSGSSILGGVGNMISNSAHQSVICGGYVNQIHYTADQGFIGSGAQNTISNYNDYCVIVGGELNSLPEGAQHAFLGGGYGNSAMGYVTFLGAGFRNAVESNSAYSVLAGGYENAIGPNATYASILGGGLNVIDDKVTYSTIGGGLSNLVGASSAHATIPGGSHCEAWGTNAFAAGYRARAMHEGTFVWADRQSGSFTSSDMNQFLVRAAGGMGVNTPSPAFDVDVRDGQAVLRLNSLNANAILRLDSTIGGVSNVWTVENGIYGDPGLFGIFHEGGGPRLVINTNGYVGIGTLTPTQRLQVVNAVCDGNTWYDSSDRNLKENLEPVDNAQILEQLAEVPIQSWNYKTDEPAVQHVGPMAQDFYQAFELGRGETTIASIDQAGVAFAAIQALYERNKALEARVEELEHLLRSDSAE